MVKEMVEKRKLLRRREDVERMQRCVAHDDFKEAIKGMVPRWVFTFVIILCSAAIVAGMGFVTHTVQDGQEKLEKHLVTIDARLLKLEQQIGMPN